MKVWYHVFEITFPEDEPALLFESLILLCFVFQTLIKICMF